MTRMKPVERLKMFRSTDKSMATFLLITLLAIFPFRSMAQETVPEKPRIIVSSDIGGTDPDDNQSMLHLLMYSDKFQIEGLISSPSFGQGSVEEIKRMISVYEKDFPKLRKSYPNLMTPKSLLRLCKQGHRGLFGLKGFDKPTEGSKWIVKQARKRSAQPLWILVWGSLEDVAQALHDAPDIQKNIRVYYIGGPNKKWGVYSYNYVARHFPDLWMIENNSTYRGFIANDKRDDRYNKGFYDYALKGAGHIGADFIHYYKGVPKMGDTPALLYMMDGDPQNPTKESWGGRFTKIKQSARRVFNRPLTEADTVAVYSVMELHFEGPAIAVADDSVVFTATIDKQTWNGYYAGEGDYVLLYSPKAPARLSYVLSSELKELDKRTGAFVVAGVWPGKMSTENYSLGNNWYTDVSEKQYFQGQWQGAKTQECWRKAILDDWAQRLKALRQ